MKDDGINRREFLKGTLAGGAVAATAAVGLAPTAEAQQKPAAPAHPGYAFLSLDEAAFVEAVVDHMVPADQASPVICLKPPRRTMATTRFRVRRPTLLAPTPTPAAYVSARANTADSASALVASRTPGAARISR